MDRYEQVISREAEFQRRLAAYAEALQKFRDALAFRERNRAACEDLMIRAEERLHQPDSP